jgi:hypothetical protein
MEEIWKDVKDWEQYYQVSNIGRVKSKDRYVTQSCGSVNRRPIDVLKKGKMLGQRPNSNGYLRVTLSDAKTNRKKQVFVHRLVASAFVFLNSEKPHVNHIDFNYLNNNYTNLEWCTHKENMQHSLRAGRMKRTEEYMIRSEIIRRKYYKKVIGVNIKNGYIVMFDKLNGSRDMGFNPPDVCRSCKSAARVARGYKFDYVT